VLNFAKILILISKGKNMSKIEKIKRTALIALGFAMATYLIMSGTAMLNKKDVNATQKVKK
jgi:hypothetical protein